jgi:hypothetical protein
MLLSTLALSLLPASLAFADANLHARSRARSVEHTLSKRQTFSGRATYFAVGLGACGWNNVASDYIVALNTAQYGSGSPGPECGKSITISYNGNTATATIADECPSCGYGDLDFSQGLFEHFASTDVGQFQMSWWYNDGSSQQTTTSQTPTSTYTPPTSTYTPPTSTYTPPTSTYVAPSTTSTSSAAPSSSSSSAAASSAASSSASSVVPSASISALPYIVQTNGTDTNSTGTTSSGPQPTYADPKYGNLVLFNQAVTYLGNVIVVGAGGS